MRLRVEFTTEPFDLDEAPEHAVVAREVIETAELDAVDVGPFGNTAEGGADAVLSAVDALLRRTLTAGATRVSLQINVVGEGDR
ncbi:hypothetical protein HTV80_05885 [Streptomyces sp. Vc74B-19]|uniref:hypothetical protein n=1 Tax=unclassified Streptomyces TaxID=2593676 RepID=UPI001BFC6478|nr:MULTISPECIES: hypothetical protein [unclassified Streptomyces]MBT3162638.1 hypothetical protein [Streptomyces sp. Vc74B-19]MCO4694504.1 hypothetical protein [Streptomyces sp. RO-S4]MDU0299360.1 hypothetical protein [Streptomyces sp. PAL114]